jgi:hypothetical protein
MEEAEDLDESRTEFRNGRVDRTSKCFMIEMGTRKSNITLKIFDNTI